jgi:hypothetical protein
MVQILAIHMTGGERHEHIAELRWRNLETTETGAASRAAMVKFIRDDKGRAYVQDGNNAKNWIGWVDADPPYVRTHADGYWNNNLLALPRY